MVKICRQKSLSKKGKALQNGKFKFVPLSINLYPILQETIPLSKRHKNEQVNFTV